MEPILPLGTDFGEGVHSVALLGGHPRGQVFLALDQEGRTRAVKVLAPDLFDAAALSAFEADASSDVAGVVGAKVSPDKRFAVRAHVSGTSLDQVLAGRARVHPDLARDIVHAVAERLRELHKKGRSHGAIKPGNIVLVGRDGPLAVHLLDIGTHHLEVRQGGDDETTVYTDSALEYRAPGLRPGKKATPRDDLFSLGVLLYRMLAGRVPYPGGLSYSSRCVPLSELAPDAGDDLRGLTERLLALGAGGAEATAEQVLQQTARVERTSVWPGDPPETEFVKDNHGPDSTWTPAGEERGPTGVPGKQTEPRPQPDRFVVIVLALTVVIIVAIIALAVKS